MKRFHALFVFFVLVTAAASASVVSDLTLTGTVESFDANRAEIRQESGAVIKIRRDALVGAENIRPGDRVTARVPAQEFLALKPRSEKKTTSKARPLRAD